MTVTLYCQLCGKLSRSKNGQPTHTSNHARRCSDRSSCVARRIEAITSAARALGVTLICQWDASTGIIDIDYINRDDSISVPDSIEIVLMMLILVARDMRGGIMSSRRRLEAHVIKAYQAVGFSVVPLIGENYMTALMARA